MNNYRLKIEKFLAKVSIAVSLLTITIMFALLIENADEKTASFGILFLGTLVYLAYKITVYAVWHIEDINEVLSKVE